MLPGLLPFLDWPLAVWHPMPQLLVPVVSVIIVGLAAAVLHGFCRIDRAGENKQDALAAVLGYAGSVLATLFLFPSHSELAFTVLAVLAFGDGSATFVGLLLGGPRLSWNPKKTVSGTLCFLFVGTLMATLTYWGQANTHLAPMHAPITLAIAFLCAFPAVLLGAFAESLPLRMNDNARVGIAASLGVIAAQALVVGF
jgi:dolichol kinase